MLKNLIQGIGLCFSFHSGFHLRICTISGDPFIRRRILIFDESIKSACQRLTWDQDASTWKKKLCLKEGFDGKAKGKVCRVFGGEPTSDDGNVQDLCNRINIQSSRIARKTWLLKWNAKALCNKKKYGKATKEGKLCRHLKWA